MKAQHLVLLCLGISGLSAPALATDQAACAVYHSAIEANLKQLALSNTLAVTTRDPQLAASSTQTAASTRLAIEQTVHSMEQSACSAYPAPLDPSGYNTDAMRCAYELLQQRPDAAQCDQQTWTVKERIETWHTLGDRPRKPD